ncbi:MAG TPA: LacI family transcriptional regulator, partial [Firmicutes bacterium]|nr:LacI family transcriptional regulator [Bacillota bacterium]
MVVTIRDVARRAGVSKSTVSRVINNLPVVDPRTRERVLEAIRELGYAPNGVARGLATRKTGTVGLIMSDIANPFCPDVARGVEDVLREHDYNVILCNTDDRAEKETEYIRLLVSKRVEGIIFTSVRSGASDLSLLADHDIPFVLASRDIEGFDADVVIVDDV